MILPIRKSLLHVEETRIEGGREAPVPVTFYAAAVVVANPWAGFGFVEDLRPKMQALAPVLGRLLTDMCCDRAGVFARSRSRRTELDHDLDNPAAV